MISVSSGITGFKSDSLKPTETVEKVVLPGKEEIKTEKTIKGVLDGVKGFESESLKNVKTKEPASPIAVAQVCIKYFGNIFITLKYLLFRLRRLESPVCPPSVISTRQR